MNEVTFIKLAAGIELEITEIDRELERVEQRWNELRRERAYKASGLVGIHYEIKKLREQGRLNDN